MNPNISFTTGTLLTALAAVVVLIFAAIVFFRWYYRRQSDHDLTAKYKGKQWRSPLEARSKYPEVDVFKMRGSILGLSMAASLGLIILAMNWTTFEKSVYIPDNALALDEEIEIEPPRSTQEQPPPPPPPPPVIQEVPDAEIITDDEPEFVDQSVDAETMVEAPVFHEDNTAAPPPPPPPPMKEPDIEEIFKIVEDMPRFPGCETAGLSKEEKKACSDKKMLEFIYNNIRYPDIARENNVEGTVVVSFVVDEKGNVTQATIVRDIGASCGQEALRIVQLMNNMPDKWTPGRQRGRAVKVLFNLPIRFKLEHL